MDKLFAAIEALNAGKSLANSTIWKRGHIAFPYIVTIVTFLSAIGCGSCITAPDIDTLSLGIEVLGGAIVNHLLIVATTKKLGIRTNAQSNIDNTTN